MPPRARDPLPGRLKNADCLLRLCFVVVGWWSFCRFCFGLFVDSFVFSLPCFHRSIITGDPIPPRPIPSPPCHAHHLPSCPSATAADEAPSRGAGGQVPNTPDQSDTGEEQNHHTAEIRAAGRGRGRNRRESEDNHGIQIVFTHNLVTIINILVGNISEKSWGKKEGKLGNN